MFCTKCGSPNFDDAIVCKKCAYPFTAKFTRPNRTVTSQAPGLKRLTIQLLGWGLIGATLIMGLVLVTDLNDARNTPSSSAPSAYVAPAIEAPEEKAVSTSGFTDDESRRWARRNLHDIDIKRGAEWGRDGGTNAGPTLPTPQNLRRKGS